MKIDKRLFKRSDGSILFVAHAASLILVLFGLTFTLLNPSQPDHPVSDRTVGSLLFQTTGGWLLLAGIALFLITLFRLWVTRGWKNQKPDRSQKFFH
ncbi:hypothetical protein [Paludifilum halophilum]|uniref:Uncharacterized protein n=1 Tax=Paludifilum halophilum TaxID=1642702 RepID=A0A235B4L9_9BACL|nr:hypothetical protein [Paludifilum halophilum]OYD07181.1 hypothetical protein CHM34_12400 [Paludifilum halophilum]